MSPQDKIYIAGHRGMVGSAIVRALQQAGYHNLLLRTRAELDLLDQAAVTAFFEAERPDYVFLAAAKVGGILANNTQKADFLYENLQIQSHIIHNAYRTGVRKLLFLGSSCIYPKLAPQPLREDYLLTGPLEPTNDAYAIAKIAGIKMCESYRSQYGCHFISVMPTNLYGPNDNYDLQNSHVLPALIRKMHEAKQQGLPQVVVWGDGSPRREFLHADDLADACLYLMQHYDEPELINIGTGEDIPIGDLARLIREIVGYTGELVFDTSKPNGTPRKLMDVAKLHSRGWHHRIGLEDGIRQVYAEYAKAAV